MVREGEARSESQRRQYPARVPHVPEEVWAGSLQRIGSYRWRQAESQAVLEGWAVVWAVKHRLKALHGFATMHFVLGDGTALACTKGRPSAPGHLLPVSLARRRGLPPRAMVAVRGQIQRQGLAGPGR